MDLLYPQGLPIVALTLFCAVPSRCAIGKGSHPREMRYPAPLLVEECALLIVDPLAVNVSIVDACRQQCI